MLRDQAIRYVKLINFEVLGDHWGENSVHQVSVSVIDKVAVGADRTTTSVRWRLV